MVGSTVSHYRIDEKLGEGGMGIVYKAKDLRLGRLVALKFLNKRSQRSESGHARFEREAQVISKLNHPHIATLYDYDKIEDTPFLVMEYLPGGTLGDYMDAVRASGETVPLARVLDFAVQVGEALAYAHRCGTIHRDLKPDNVMLTAEGRLKVTDFGLAKIRGEQTESEGARLGTPAYMSPEQVAGGQVDHRSDMFSFGVLLFELATKQLPFDSIYELSLLYEIVNSPAPEARSVRPDLPRFLNDIIQRTMEKEPGDRFSRMEEIVAAITEGEAPAGGAAIPIPPLETTATAGAAVFVGRKAELARMQVALGRSIAGNGQIVLLSGDAGGGKTRMIDVFCERARRAGCLVLKSYCHETEGSPAFWPWREILLAALSSGHARAAVESLGPAAARLGRLASEVRERLQVSQDEGEDRHQPPSQARFLLFESVAVFLRRFSVEQPLIVVLDDIHWGDEASLRLMGFVGAALKDSRILLVGAFRNLEFDRDHPLSRVLGQVARQEHVTRIEIEGLSRENVAELIELSLGRSTSDEFIETLVSQTRGNAFFVTEVIKLLADAGGSPAATVQADSINVPQSVREALVRRLVSLSPDCARTLELAAVIGADFQVDVLTEISPLDPDRVLDALDEAQAARLILAPSEDSDSYSFTHAIVHDAIHDSLRPAETRRLHRSVGEALEAIYATDRDEVIHDLAYHFFRAGTKADAEKAVAYAARAAEKAGDRLAYEEAGALYDRIVQLMERHRLGDGRRRAEILCKAGEEFKRAGNAPRARECFQKVAEVARHKGLAEEFGKAAIGIGASPVEAAGVIDPLQVQLLEEAIPMLPTADSPLRCRLLAELSAALASDQVRRNELSLEALAMARRLGDRDALLAALACRHNALTVTPDLNERANVAAESLHLAEQSGSVELMLGARFRRILDFMEMGKTNLLEAEIDVYVRVAEDLRQPRYLWLSKFFRASLALFRGQLTTAERLCQEALAIGTRAQDPIAHVFYMALMNLLRSIQGRIEEHLPILQESVKRYPLIPGNNAILAYYYALTQRLAECRERFEEVAKHDFEDFPRDGSFIVVLSSLSVVCWALQDTVRAKRIYGLLLPYAGRNITMGRSGVGCGSIARAYGYCTEACNDLNEAIRHYREAVAENASMEGKPFEIGAKFDLGRALLARGEPADRIEAAEVLAQAQLEAHQLGIDQHVKATSTKQMRSMVTHSNAD
jgi:predicted ATPase